MCYLVTTCRSTLARANTIKCNLSDEGCLENRRQARTFGLGICLCPGESFVCGRVIALAGVSVVRKKGRGGRVDETGNGVVMVMYWW